MAHLTVFQFYNDDEKHIYMVLNTVLIKLHKLISTLL